MGIKSSGSRASAARGIIARLTGVRPARPARTALIFARFAGSAPSVPEGDQMPDSQGDPRWARGLALPIGGRVFGMAATRPETEAGTFAAFAQRKTPAFPPGFLV
ncbi:MAG: hypothetical protein Kow0013_24720 [Pararhodobacter sp.]